MNSHRLPHQNPSASRGRAAAWIALVALLAALLPAAHAAAQVPPQATISADDADEAEGNGTATGFTFTITFDHPPLTGTVDVHYRTVGSTASALAGDYAGTEDSTVTFAATDTSKTVTIPVDGDGHAEGDETFLVELLPGEGYTVGTPSEATGTIRNDDPHVTFADRIVDVTEGSDATVPLALSEAHMTDVQVTYSTSDGDATAADADYTAPDGGSGTVTIPAGDTGADITIPTDADGTSEPCETFTVQIDSVTAAGEDPDPAFGPDAGTATVLIIDDQTCVFADDDVEVTEGDSSPVQATVTVRAAPAPTTSVDVDYATADGTATTADGDYLEASGRLTFAAGETAKAVPATVAADSDDESREDLTVDLTLPTGETDATLPAATASATITILDDDGVNDARPIVAIDPPTVDEGDTGTTDAVFALSLVEETTTMQPLAADEDITVRFRTQDGSNGDVTDAHDGVNFSTEDHDYDPRPSADSSDSWVELTIPAGQTSADIAVTVIGDTVYEVDETFDLTVEIPAGQNAVFPDGESQNTATATILNDDPVPTVSIDDVTDHEGDAFEDDFLFTVSLSNPTQLAGVTVNHTTSDGTAHGGSADCEPDPETCDYEETSGNLEIPRCEDARACPSSGAVPVRVKHDTAEEPDETFTVELTLVPNETDDERPGEPDAYMADSSGLGTILNDDGPELSITEAVSALEGDSGTEDLVFTVTLSEARTDGEDVTVDVTTDDGTATANLDYQPESRTVTVPAGETSVDVAVTVNGDTDREPDETFTVTLSNPVNAEIAPGKGRGTGEILNDDGDPDADQAPTAVIDGDTSGTEGDELTFDGSGSSDPDGTIAEYAWVFGDGSGSARGKTVTHTFPDDGTYTVALRVTDDQGGIDIVEVDVTIGNADPTATAEGPTTVEVHQPVTYTGAGSDPGNDQLTFAWDLPDGTSASGQTVEHAFAEPGTRQVTLRVTDDDGGVGTDTIAVEVTSDTGEVGRHAGTDRIATAVAVSAANWDTATDAVLATAGNYPDALAGGPLAARLDAPLLLTPTDQLHDAVRDELSRLGVQRVWLLGGPAALSQTVEDQLAAAGYDVHRFEGPDRFVTAAVIAAGLGPSPDGEVMITLGTDWADALSAGALAAAGELPTLLTTPTELPPATAQALDFMGARTVHLIGGTAAISQTVEDELAQLGYQVNRLAGPERYATSVAVAQEALDHLPADPFAVPAVFATGQKFPDGLSAAALAARTGAILQLVPGSGDLTPELRTFLSDNAHRIDLGHVVGGTAVVTDHLRDQLRTAITG